MTAFNAAMDVFKLLPKTNCKQCNKPTCLAFAAAVFQGNRPLSDCPFIAPELLERFADAAPEKPDKLEVQFEKEMARLKQEIQQVDLAHRAQILGAAFHRDRLTLKILGKDFSVDRRGEIFTDIHVNPWIAPPVFAYILTGKGLEPTGNWVPFRELPTAGDWVRFFDHRCVGALKQVADANPGFFEDIIELFNGRPVENHYQADVALTISPLPRLPMLLCYNRPEDGLDSDFNLFFDTTADQNLPIESIYGLTTGLATMLKKLADNHA